MRGHDESSQAAGSVIGGTGVATKIRGAASARTGAGTYTITLDQPLNAADCVVRAQVRGGAANCNCRIVHTTDAVKTITTHVGAAAAADQNFDFEVKRISIGTAS